MEVNRAYSTEQRASFNQFVTDEDADEINHFTTAMDETRLTGLSNSEMVGDTTFRQKNREMLLKDFPDSKDTIESFYKGKVSGRGDVTSALTDLGGTEVDYNRKMFDTGKIYMDPNGDIKSNSTDMEKYVNVFQDDLKSYWNFRQLTDGTKYDVANDEKRKINIIREEIFRLRQDMSKSSGFIDDSATFLGGLAGAMTDPISILTLGVGAVPAVGKGVVGNMASTAGREAGLALVGEGIIQQKVYAYQRLLYDPSRGIEAFTAWDAVGDALLNSATAGLLVGAGSVIRDTGTMASVSVRKYRKQMKSTESGMGDYKGKQLSFQGIDELRGRRAEALKVAQSGSVRTFQKANDDFRNMTAKQVEEYNQATGIESGVAPSGLGKAQVIQYGDPEWRRIRKLQIAKSLKQNTLNNERVGDELVDEIVNTEATSPMGDIDEHVANIDQSIVHQTNNTRFPDEDMTRTLDVAFEGDMVTFRDEAGEQRIMKVIDSDADTITFDMDGEMVLVDRATGDTTAGGKAGEPPEMLQVREDRNTVNEVNVERLLQVEPEEASLIKKFEEDPEIAEIKKGVDDTVSKLDKCFGISKETTND